MEKQNEYFNVEELKFNIKVTSPSGKVIDVNPLAQVLVDEEHLKDQTRLLPAQYAFFTSVYLMAKKNRDRAELGLNRLKAGKSKEIRVTHKKTGAKGIEKELTIREVDEYLAEDKEIIQKEDELLDLTIYANQCYYVISALDKKQFSLGSLSYMQAQEKKLMDNLNKDHLLNDTNISIDPNLFEKKQKEKE